MLLFFVSSRHSWMIIMLKEQDSCPGLSFPGRRQSWSSFLCKRYFVSQCHMQLSELLISSPNTAPGCAQLPAPVWGFLSWPYHYILSLVHPYTSPPVSIATNVLYRSGNLCSFEPREPRYHSSCKTYTSSSLWASCSSYSVFQSIVYFYLSSD